MFKREVYFYQLINLSGGQKDGIRLLPYDAYPDRHGVGGGSQSVGNGAAIGSWFAMHRNDIDYVFSLLDEGFVNVYYSTLEATYPNVSKKYTRCSLPVYCRNISGRTITINANAQYYNGRLPNNTPGSAFGKKLTLSPGEMFVLTITSKEECSRLFDLLETTRGGLINTSYTLFPNEI